MKPLSDDELALLRRAVQAHDPKLLPLVESAVNVRRLSNAEGNALRQALAGEIDASLDDYSLQVDQLIDRVGEQMDWD